jgi:hypothetical protein
VKYNYTPSSFNENEITWSRKVLCFLILILFICICGPYLYTLFDKYIVNKVIGKIYQPKLNIFQIWLTVFIFIAAVITMVFRWGLTRYILNLNYIYLFSFPSGLYLYERISNSRFEFTKLFKPGTGFDINLLDIPLVLYIIGTVILFNNRFIKKGFDSVENDLLFDVPLEDVRLDRFERSRVYETVINQISSIQSGIGKSFNIGIVNQWGEGKTSFLHFLENRLNEDKENTIIIKFNAWSTQKSANMTIDFFKTIDEELSKYLDTGSLIRNYANGVKEVDSVVNPIKYMPKSWVEEPSTLESFNQIQRMLDKLKKRVFIFIDDIDRLDNNEVFEVLRLIRNSANFPHIIFVVPFDKEYVLHALAATQIYKPKEYIKKIFDLEISLTPIFDNYLQPLFIEIMEIFVETKLILADRGDIDALQGQIKAIFQNIGLSTKKGTKYNAIRETIFKILRNKRDIIRFTNSLKISLKENFKKLYLPDLLIIELIKYEDLPLYRRLFENRLYLLTKNIGNRKVLELYLGIKEQTTPLMNFLGVADDMEILIDENVPAEVDADRMKRKAKFSENLVNNPTLVMLLKALFSAPEPNDYHENLSIYYEMNFLNYIQFSDENIAYEDIEDLLNE